MHSTLLPAKFWNGHRTLQAGSNREDKASYEQDILEARAEIESFFNENPVVVYTYDWSPFSAETKRFLVDLDIPSAEVSLGAEWIPGLIKEGGAVTRAALLKMTGQSSLPHIFVYGKSIGGLFSGTPGLGGGRVARTFDFIG